MNDPFPDSKAITSWNLLAMIDRVNESSKILDDVTASNDKLIIALPPVQRSAVWRPKQVVDLWDSLFRGLPIGMFYLVKRAEGSSHIVTWRNKTRELDLPGYDLLDGQQRIRALLTGAFGFTEEKRCLWIDLGSQDAARHPVLYITSKGQPFGYDVKTGNKLSLEERRRARKRIEGNVPLVHKDSAGNERGAYHRELFEDEVTQGGIRISQPPLPFAASEHTFKLPDLLDAWRTSASNSDDEGIAALRAVTGADPSQEPLIKLHEAFKRIRNAEVALLQINPQDFSQKEDLLQLFDRVGAGGTPLSVEERLYSIYKYHMPHIRDAANAIYDQVGRVLSPTKIATTAIRIAYAEAHDDRNDTPDVATFSRLVTDQHEKRFLDYLTQLIPPESQEANTKGTLLRSLQTIKTLLWYREGVGHFWIPEVLLVSFPSELWQVLAYWAWRHPNTDHSKLSRQEAVRFALFWHLTVSNNEKGARWAFAHIKENKSADFPGAAFYERFTGNREDSCAHKLIPSEVFKRKLCQKDTSSWRTDAERFEENGSRNELSSHWWWNGKKMLPWLQKDYIRRVFQDYVPLTDHEDDVPYDVDHMCPSKDWGDDRRNLRLRLDLDESQKNRVYECRDAVGRGIGNLRLLESSLNRADQDSDIADKMIFLRHAQQPTDIDKDEMNDFAFPTDDLQRALWRKVSRPGLPVADRRWSKDRLLAFQEAVELRAAWLYQRFHDDLNYDLWTKDR